MKNLLCLLILTVYGVSGSAQNQYFIYFEAGNAQPFYLKMDDKVYSSNSSGSFTLPGLSDSIYNLSVGFPSSSSEARFRLNVNGRDHGFTIGSYDFGLGLSDLQSMAVTKPQLDQWNSNITYQYRYTDFTSLLAKASNDTTLFYIPVYKKEDVAEQKVPVDTVNIVNHDIAAKDTGIAKDRSVGLVAPAAVGLTEAVLRQNEKGDTPFIFPGAMAAADTSVNAVRPVITDTMIAQTAVVPVPETVMVKEDSIHTLHTADSTLLVRQDSMAIAAPVTAAYMRSTVRRSSETSTSEGLGLVFYDIYEGGSDTIALVIPAPRIAVTAADTIQFEEGLLEIKKDTLPAKKATPGASCAAVATDNDFFKLRKNMAAKESDDEMINEAKKFFRNKCFSTGQVRNLSSLFLNDESKYRFFDAAYTHVTDQEVFYALQAELKDAYYLKRFKALIGE